MSDAWEDEGFGAENDWSEESLESDLEEDELLDEDESDPSELEDDDLEPDEDDEQ